MDNNRKNSAMSPACSPVCSGFGKTMMCILLLSDLCSCLHRYHFIHEPKTRNEARDFCREKYTNLANIGSMEDMNRLIAAAGGYEGKVWIGLKDELNSWVWSLSALGFYGPGQKYFKMWQKGQPNHTYASGWMCTFLYNGFWYDDDCQRYNPFVCYDNTIPLDLETTSTKRYFFVNKGLSWVEAQAYCRKYHTDLVSVRNITEHNVVIQAVPNTQRVWIGLWRYTWIWWSDYKYSSFKNWADGQPFSLTDNCAASVINATFQGKWVGNHCGDKLPFMCYHDKTQLLTVKLKALQTMTDLNDHAAAILNLLEKKLKENGIIRDVRISWVKKPDKNIFHKEEEKANEVKTDL